jgi:hypothetical protein
LFVLKIHGFNVPSKPVYPYPMFFLRENSYVG